MSFEQWMRDKLNPFNGGGNQAVQPPTLPPALANAPAPNIDPKVMAAAIMQLARSGQAVGQPPRPVGGPSTSLAAPHTATRWGDTIGSVNAAPPVQGPPTPAIYDDPAYKQLVASGISSTDAMERVITANLSGNGAIPVTPQEAQAGMRSIGMDRPSMTGGQFPAATPVSDPQNQSPLNEIGSMIAGLNSRGNNSLSEDPTRATILANQEMQRLAVEGYQAQPVDVIAPVQTAVDVATTVTKPNVVADVVKDSVLHPMDTGKAAVGGFLQVASYPQHQIALGQATHVYKAAKGEENWDDGSTALTTGAITTSTLSPSGIVDQVAGALGMSMDEWAKANKDTVIALYEHGYEVKDDNGKVIRTIEPGQEAVIAGFEDSMNFIQSMGWQTYTDPTFLFLPAGKVGRVMKGFQAAEDAGFIARTAAPIIRGTGSVLEGAKAASEIPEEAVFGAARGLGRAVGSIPGVTPLVDRITAPSAKAVEEVTTSLRRRALDQVARADALLGYRGASPADVIGPVPITIGDVAPVTKLDGEVYAIGDFHITQSPTGEFSVVGPDGSPASATTFTNVNGAKVEAAKLYQQAGREGVGAAALPTDITPANPLDGVNLPVGRTATGTGGYDEAIQQRLMAQGQPLVVAPDVVPASPVSAITPDAVLPAPASDVFDQQISDLEQEISDWTEEIARPKKDRTMSLAEARKNLREATKERDRMLAERASGITPETVAREGNAALDVLGGSTDAVAPESPASAVVDPSKPKFTEDGDPIHAYTEAELQEVAKSLDAFEGQIGSRVSGGTKAEQLRHNKVYAEERRRLQESLSDAEDYRVREIRDRLTDSELAAKNAAPAPLDVPAEAVEAPSAPVDPADVTKSTPPKEDGYGYHITSRNNLYDIEDSGVIDVFPPEHGTDQLEWPDGSESPRSYWIDNPKNALAFAPDDGVPVLIRKSNTTLKPERGTRDLYTESPIDISQENVEFWGDDGAWHPLGKKPVVPDITEPPIAPIAPEVPAGPPVMPSVDMGFMGPVDTAKYAERKAAGTLRAIDRVAHEIGPRDPQLADAFYSVYQDIADASRAEMDRLDGTIPGVPPNSYPNAKNLRGADRLKNRAEKVLEEVRMAKDANDLFTEMFPTETPPTYRYRYPDVEVKTGDGVVTGVYPRDILPADGRWSPEIRKKADDWWHATHEGQRIVNDQLRGESGDTWNALIERALGPDDMDAAAARVTIRGINRNFDADNLIPDQLADDLKATRAELYDPGVPIESAPSVQDVETQSIRRVQKDIDAGKRVTSVSDIPKKAAGDTRFRATVTFDDGTTRDVFSRGKKDLADKLAPFRDQITGASPLPVADALPTADVPIGAPAVDALPTPDAVPAPVDAAPTLPDPLGTPPQPVSPLTDGTTPFPDQLTDGTTPFDIPETIGGNRAAAPSLDTTRTSAIREPLTDGISPPPAPYDPLEAAMRNGEIDQEAFDALNERVSIGGEWKQKDGVMTLDGATPDQRLIDVFTSHLKEGMTPDQAIAATMKSVSPKMPGAKRFKIVSGFARLWNGATNFSREHLMFNALTGPRGIVADLLGDTWSQITSGRVMEASQGFDLKRAYTIYRDIRNGSYDALSHTDTGVMGSRLGLVEPSFATDPIKGLATTGREEVAQSGAMGVNRFVQRIARGSGASDEAAKRIGSLTGVLASEHLRDIRVAMDINRRWALYGGEMARQLPKQRESFFSTVRALGREGADADGLIAALGDEFSPKDVRRLAKEAGFEQGIGERMARDWRTAVSKIDKTALADVNKIAFDFSATRADEVLKKIFMFHTWQARAAPLYLRNTLRNPALASAYGHLMDDMQRDCEGRVGATCGYLELWNTGAGYAMYANPTMLLSSALVNLEPNQWQNPDATMLDRILGVVPAMVNPMLQGIISGLGYSAVGAPDVLSTYTMRKTLGGIVDFGRARGWLGSDGTNLGDPMYGNFLEKLQQATYDWVGVHLPGTQSPAGMDPQARDNELIQMRIRDLVYAEYDIPLTTSIDDLAQLNPAAFEALDTSLNAWQTSKPDPYANQAFRDYTAGALTQKGAALAIPGGVRVRGESQDSLTLTRDMAEAQGNESLRRSASGSLSIPRLGSETATGVEFGQAAVRASVSDPDRRLLDAWTAIAFGDDPAAYVAPTGVYVGSSQIPQGRNAVKDAESNAKITALTKDERIALADQWVASQPNGTTRLEAARAAQDETRMQYPDEQAYHDWAKGARENIPAFRDAMVKGNPNYARYIDGYDEYVKSMTDKGLTDYQSLDDFSISRNAYLASQGEKAGVYDNAPLAVSNPAAVPFNAAATGTATSQPAAVKKDPATKLMEDIQKYQTEVALFNMNLQSFTGNPNASLDQMNPQLRQAMEWQMANIGISVPSMPSSVDRYGKWATIQQQQGKPADVASYVAFVGNVEAELAGKGFDAGMVIDAALAGRDPFAGTSLANIINVDQ